MHSYAEKTTKSYIIRVCSALHFTTAGQTRMLLVRIFSSYDRNNEMKEHFYSFTSLLTFLGQRPKQHFL